MSDSKQIAVRRISQAILSAPPGSPLAALIDETIDAIDAIANLSASQSDAALVESFLTAAKSKAALQDIGIIWEPANVDIVPLMGLFAYDNDNCLPGITRLTINHTTNREGYDFEDYSGEHPLQSLRLPNYTGPSEGGYLTILGFPNLTVLELPKLVHGGGGLTFGGLGVAALSIPVTELNFFSIRDNLNLTSLALPDLVDSTGNVTISNSPVLASISAPLYATSTALVIDGGAALGEVSLPSLVSVDGLLAINNLPALTSINLPALAEAYFIALSACLALEELVLPSLTDTVSVSIDGCPALAHISWPQWLPENTSTLAFTGLALTAASVNHILARCIANPDFTGTLDLSGGTSSAPTGQGIIDAAALVTRGCTVTTN